MNNVQEVQCVNGESFTSALQCREYPLRHIGHMTSSYKYSQTNKSRTPYWLKVFLACETRKRFSRFILTTIYGCMINTQTLPQANTCFCMAAATEIEILYGCSRVGSCILIGGHSLFLFYLL